MAARAHESIVVEEDAGRGSAALREVAVHSQRTALHILTHDVTRFSLFAALFCLFVLDELGERSLLAL
jgi:hypothetical protein